MKASCGHEMPEGETRKRGFCNSRCFLGDSPIKLMIGVSSKIDASGNIYFVK